MGKDHDRPHAGSSPNWIYRQDCIPYAHFDTFTWGLITVYQIMTGENWNTIMYAAMRAGSAWDVPFDLGSVLAAILFVIIIMFGQTLFLSLFLSMLISKFGEVSEQVKKEEELKKEQKKQQKLTRKSSQ